MSFEKVQELLEWSPIVIVAEDQLRTILSWGIKIDAILCAQPASIIFDEQLKDQFPLQFISYSPANSLRNVVEYLVERKSNTLNLLANSTEDFMEVQNYPHISIEVFLNNQKWTWVTNRPFEKWLSEGTSLAIFPAETKVSTIGLSKALTCYQNGMVQICSINDFWVGEQI